jgi:DNA polymerase III delta subunit
MLKPVYALVGSDPFLQLEKLQSLLRAAPPDVQRIDADGERAELAEVLDELRSFAMFGGGKLVTVRNADAFVTRFREQLETYLSSPSNSSTLVLRMSSLPKTQRIYKLIAKAGAVEECEPPRDVARWAIDRGKSVHKIALSPEAARLLVELIGDDLGRLDNELAKLALSSDTGKVDAGGITASVAFQREQDMYDMTGELAAGRPAAALKRWRQLIQLDPSAEFKAVTWLTMWLEDVRAYHAAKRSGREGEFTRRIGWKYKGDRLRDFTATANKLGERGLARAVSLLAEVDHHSKSGLGDASENVERFIVSLSG